MKRTVSVLGLMAASVLPQGELRAQDENRDALLPFEREIQAFERMDAKRMPPPGGTVCVGSSTIRMWRTIAEDLAPLPVVHRGFGGAQMRHVLHSIDRIVIPYRPARILLYAGENDLAAGASVDQVVKDTEDFFRKIHEALPDARVVYVSMKPSPKRWHLWPRFAEANRRIEQIASRFDRVEYIDVTQAMLDENGMPKPDLYLPDRLHMNAQGYRLWTAIIKPRLMNP